MKKRIALLACCILFMPFAQVDAQEKNEFRVLNLTIDTFDPTNLQINRGHIIWKDRKFNSLLYSLKFFTGAEIVKLDSEQVNLSAAIDGDFIVWNTSGEAVKVYDIRNWTTTSPGESYNPDGLQPVSVANGLLAYPRRKSVGSGTEIILHDLNLAQDTNFSAAEWNVQPSVHHGQLAWVGSDNENLGISSDIFYFDGNSTRTLATGGSERNEHPILKDGQVIWLQTDGDNSRVQYFTGDSTIVLAAPVNSNTVIQGYDLSNGFAVAALSDTVTGSSQIVVYNSETNNSILLLENEIVSSPHIDNGLVSWVVNSEQRIKSFDITTQTIEIFASADAAVGDDRQFAWTFGEAVEFGFPITFEQITGDSKNGWEQTRFKNLDAGEVIWGNYENSQDMRLFYRDVSLTTQLTDSSVFKDFVMANEGYAIWRHNFDFLWLYDGSNPPTQIIDGIQLENPYLAGGSIGFFGFDINDNDQIKHAWLYDIQAENLTQLTAGSTDDNWIVLCDGNTACWRNQNTEKMMFFDGSAASELSESTVDFVYSYRNGKIVWSEDLNDIWQIMMFDVATSAKTQLTNGTNHNVFPVTDGTRIVWFENSAFPSPSPESIMWYYDIASKQARKVTRFFPTTFRWLWLDNGNIAWSKDGRVFVFDGQTISMLTDEFLKVADAQVDNEIVVWRKTPNPNFNNNGDIFRARLHPKVAFDALNITGPPPLTVSFFNYSWQGAQSFEWDFGDGISSTERDPVHIYQSAGKFTVTLTVTGPTGQVSERKLNLVRAAMATSVRNENEALPTDFALFQNYPNPFNPSTTIEFTLPGAGFVSLTVFNIIGDEVATVVSEKLDAGQHKVHWNAEELSSGVFFYRLQSGSNVRTKKLLLLK